MPSTRWPAARRRHRGLYLVRAPRPDTPITEIPFAGLKVAAPYRPDRVRSATSARLSAPSTSAAGTHRRDSLEYKCFARLAAGPGSESPRYWPRLDGIDHDVTPQLMSTSRLADVAARDAELMQIAALYAGHADFDVNQLVANLVAAESVPFLPALRYTDTGLRKRVQWEETWALQRREDSGEDVGKIPVPPKYQSKDFSKTDFGACAAASTCPGALDQLPRL